ncbi:MAG: transketolase [bacterium]
MEFAPNREKIIYRARDMRRDILTMINKAGSGHPAGALGMADVISTLYNSGLLKYDAKNPSWDERDIIILSNAHINPVYYSALSFAGYFKHEELFTLRKIGSRLQGHPNNHFSGLGIENSGGPLGQGLSVAVGMALSMKLRGRNERKVYCFCSDGELNEGQAWEAFMSASKYNLNNLIFIIDRNNIQIDGTSDFVMPLEPLHEKIKSFGVDCLSVDGHDVDKIYTSLKYASNKALSSSKSSTGESRFHNSPTALIMNTIPGKGVSFMENDCKWHGKSPSNEELTLALEELQ